MVITMTSLIRKWSLQVREDAQKLDNRRTAVNGYESTGQSS